MWNDAINARIDLGLVPDGETPCGELLLAAILLAIQQKKKLYIPGGEYNIDTESGALNLALDFDSLDAGLVIYGDENTKLVANTATGTGQFFIHGLNETAEKHLTLDSLIIEGIGGTVSDPQTALATTAGYGIGISAYTDLRKTVVQGFYANLVIDGTQALQQASLDGVVAQYGHYNLFVTGNDVGDRANLAVKNTLLRLARKANIGFSATGQLARASFDAVTLEDAPFHFFVETGTKTNDAVLDHVSFEDVELNRAGNAWFFCVDGDSDVKNLTGSLDIEGVQIDASHTWLPNAISGLSRTGGVVSATLPSGHGRTVGDLYRVASASDSSFNGVFTLLTVGATSATWVQAGTTDAGPYTAIGGPLCGIRAGDVSNCDLTITAREDDSTSTSDPQDRWDVRSVTATNVELLAPANMPDVRLRVDPGSSICTMRVRSGIDFFRYRALGTLGARYLTSWVAEPSMFTFGYRWLGDTIVTDTQTAEAAAINGQAIEDAIADGVRVLLPNGVIWVDRYIEVFDSSWIEGLSRQGSIIRQMPGVNADALIAGTYWINNTDRGTSNGQRDVTIKHLTVDFNWLDDTKSADLSGSIDAVVTTITLSDRTGFTTPGQLFRIDYEIFEVDTNPTSGVSANQIKVLRQRHGTAGAAHNDGADCVFVRNVSTTRDQTTSTVADGHGIALGAPYRCTIEDVSVQRAYGASYHFDSNGIDRSTAIGEGIQWNFSHLWSEYSGLCGFHNVDGHTGSNINDGFLRDLTMSYPNCRNINNGGSGSYGNLNWGHGVYNNQGAGSVLTGLHIFGNSTPPGTRAGHGGNKIKSGVQWLSSNGFRASDCKVADWGYSDSTDATYYAWNVRVLGERGNSMVGCHAYTDEDNASSSLVGISITISDTGSPAEPQVGEFTLGECTVASRVNFRQGGNDYDTTISACDNSTTTLTVADRSKTPVGSTFLVEGAGSTTGTAVEVIRVTARSGTSGSGTVTVIRGFNDTPKIAHGATSRLYRTRLTAFKLRSSDNSYLVGSITGCVAKKCLTPFDGTNDLASKLVHNAGNSWNRASSAPVDGFWPIGSVVWNSDPADDGSPGWVKTPTAWATMAAVNTP